MATNTGDENKDENLSSEESDDTFGLPDIEYQPISREEPAQEEQAQPEPEPEPEPEQTVAAQPVEESKPASTYQSSYSASRPQYRKQEEEEESSSMGIKIMGIIVLLIIGGGAGYYFLKYLPDQRKEKARQEQLALKEAADKKREEEELRKRQDAQRAAEQARLDSIAAIPKEGTIEALSGRTGRYYVVVSSAVDDDLIMDYAKKLSDKGVSSKIIPPYGKYKFYRIAVAEGDTFDDAQQKADALKQDYSDAVWVLKY